MVQSRVKQKEIGIVTPFGDACILRLQGDLKTTAVYPDTITPEAGMTLGITENDKDLGTLSCERGIYRGTVFLNHQAWLENKRAKAASEPQPT